MTEQTAQWAVCTDFFLDKRPYDLAMILVRVECLNLKGEVPSPDAKLGSDMALCEERKFKEGDSAWLCVRMRSRQAELRPLGGICQC
jgi:hypothetical protein